MGDPTSDEILWSDYFANLVRAKRADGKSAAQAQNEALEEMQRIVNGPTGPDATKKLQEQIENLTIQGMSRERASYKVVTDYFNELKKSSAQRVKEFIDGLRKQSQDAKKDSSLGDAQKVVTKGFWNKAGQPFLKSLWSDFWNGTSEHADVFKLFKEKFFVGVEETAEASRDAWFEQLNTRSFLELKEETARSFGPNAPPLPPQELFLTDSQKLIDTDVFKRFLAGSDADRALEKLGMTDLKAQNAYDAGKMNLDLAPVSDSKQNDFGKLEWSANPKVAINFRFDKFAKEGLTPDVANQVTLGGNVGVKYISPHLVLKAEAEAEGLENLKDMQKWSRVFDRDVLIARGQASGKLKGGVEYRLNAQLRFALDANIQADANRDGVKWSAGGTINMELSLEGDPAIRESREKLLRSEGQREQVGGTRQSRGEREAERAWEEYNRSLGRPPIDLGPPNPKGEPPKKP
jgi:hypothetical protein